MPWAASVWVQSADAATPWLTAMVSPVEKPAMLAGASDQAARVSWPVAAAKLAVAEPAVVPARSSVAPCAMSSTPAPTMLPAVSVPPLAVRVPARTMGPALLALP